MVEQKHAMQEMEIAENGPIFVRADHVIKGAKTILGPP